MIRAHDDPTNPRLAMPSGPYPGPLPSREELARLGVLRGFPRGTTPEYIESYYRQRLAELGYGAAQPGPVGPMISFAPGTPEDVRRAAEERVRRTGSLSPQAPPPPRPPQDTDPIRKLMEDARAQMDMQDRMREAQKQIQLEALQREAMRNGEPVMWKDNAPFLPSQNAAATEQVKDEQLKKQIADNQENYRKSQLTIDSSRKKQPQQAAPRSPHPDFVAGSGPQFGAVVSWHNPQTGQRVQMPNPGYQPKPGTGWVKGSLPDPGMAQPKEPPSQGEPYRPPQPDVYGPEGMGDDMEYMPGDPRALPQRPMGPDGRRFF